jgi:MFS family permease
MQRLRKLPPLLLAVALVVLGLTLTTGPALAQDPADGAATEEAAPEGEAAAEGDEAADEGDEAADEGDEAADEGDEAAAADAGDEEAADEGPPSPWSTGLILSMSALIVGGGSAVLGIWVDRDKSRPVSFAYAMSFLIICAIIVGCAQGYLDAVGAIQKEQDLERMLDMTYEIAVSSGDPELIALVEKEAGVSVEAAPPAAEEEEAAADTGAPAEGEEGEEAGEGTEGAEGEATDEDILAGDDAPAGN